MSHLVLAKAGPILAKVGPILAKVEFRHLGFNNQKSENDFTLFLSSEIKNARNIVMKTLLRSQVPKKSRKKCTKKSEFRLEVRHVIFNPGCNTSDPKKFFRTTHIRVSFYGAPPRHW